jgi:hypothetical protein
MEFIDGEVLGEGRGRKQDEVEDKVEVKDKKGI